MTSLNDRTPGAESTAMRRSRSQMVAALEAEGFVFSEFTCTAEGDYAAEDAEWQYKDCAHLDHVHDDVVKPVFFLVERDHFASIHLQKVLGFRFPLAHVHYMSAPDCHTYYATFFVFVLVIETSYEEIGPNRTCVRTAYSVGAPRSLKWCLPFVGWLIGRNAGMLQAGDVPVRQRRAQLRSWGYSFYRKSNHYGFDETLDISGCHVVPPEPIETRGAIRVSIDSELPDDGELLLGRDDHLGVRIMRSNSQIMVFPRMCPHEGASLDQERILHKRVTCPWHGRVCGPLGLFDLTRTDGQEVISEYHQMQLMGGILTIAPKVYEVVNG